MGVNENPLSAEMAYVYGLHLVRTKQIEQAVEYLKSAMLLDKSYPKPAYTYLLAMEVSGSVIRTDEVNPAV